MRLFLTLLTFVLLIIPVYPTAAQTESVVLIGAGDIAYCPRGYWRTVPADKTAKIIESVLNANSNAAAFTLGDNAYPNGSAADYADCYDPTWGRFKARTYPSAGNHEYGTRGAAGYFSYFGAVSAPQQDGYYSFDYGAWHIVVLNSSIRAGAGSAQEVWLRSDLAANSQVCTAALLHHPLFSSGYHGSNPQVVDLWNALYEANADVVLSGHDHHYQRFKPRAPNGNIDPQRGLKLFVVGTGGGPLYPAFSLDPANEALRSNVWGVLKLTLFATAYTWQFIDVDGAVLDSGSGVCH